MEKKRGQRGPGRSSTAARVRERIVQAGGDSYFTAGDFMDMPASAVAHALSRLAAAGEIIRAKKGVYYRPTETVLGCSTPSPSTVAARAARGVLQPAGLAAANELGLTTQNPGRVELVTTSPAAPRSTQAFHVRTRRSAERAALSRKEGALLEVLRDRARTSDLSPDATAQHLIGLVTDPIVFARLARAALAEPPRVRAMLGALGDSAGIAQRQLEPLRESLNPLSRYDFGHLRVLPTARRWQAQ